MKAKEKQSVDFENALKSLYDQSDTAKAGIASVITKEQKAEMYSFGDSETLEVLLMVSIKYLAEKDDMNLFEKLLSVQTRLAQVHPEAYQEYVKKIKELGLQ